MLLKCCLNYFVAGFADLTLAHRALAAAEILALAAALMTNFFLAGLAAGFGAAAALAATFTAGATTAGLAVPLILAQRAFWAARTLAMADALIFFWAGHAASAVGDLAVALPPSNWLSWVSSFVISSLRSAA